jgi:GR25 family glycosyltransferase involved in LPS biosynthesis
MTTLKLLLFLLSISILIIYIPAATAKPNGAKALCKAHTTLLKNTQPTKNIDIPVYYINMDKSVDRNESMQEQFRVLGIQGTRVPGVVGANITKPFSKKATLNEQGCTLAHLNAIRTAYNNGDEYALILEDDVSLLLSPLWKQTLSSLIENDAPKDWTIINMNPTKINIHPSSFKKFNALSPSWGTNAYVINRKGMSLVLTKRLSESDNSLTRHCITVADFHTYDIVGSYEHEQMLFYVNTSLLSTIITTIDNDTINTSLNTLKKYSIV